MYIFQIEKSKDSTNEEFESAIKCARTSIEGILDNEDLKITVIGNEIIIESINLKQPINISLPLCAAKIKNCFCDSTGASYSEFCEKTPIKYWEI